MSRTRCNQETEIIIIIFYLFLQKVMSFCKDVQIALELLVQTHMLI